MAESEQEFNAFLHFFATFELARPVSVISDLSDGAALFEILSIVDADYFRQSTRPSAQPSDNWVLSFGALKRLYRLMTQYFSDALHKPTTGLDVPNLQAMAKDHNLVATLGMCRLTIAIGVQCENNQEFIEKIQGLGEADQHHLMKAIEQTMQKISTTQSAVETGEAMTEDDHYYRVQSEKFQILGEKETLEKAYETLLAEHRALQTTHDDAVVEKDDALARLQDNESKSEDSRRGEKSDSFYRAEIDRIRAELQKSEENLAVSETELDKHTSMVSELNRKVDELQGKADEAVKLKDQLDEYRHAADRLQKTENVMEKYKKKLQEAAELRQNAKSLEKQNADLVDKNASLEEEYRKVAGFKPLLESYKGQIADFESKASSRMQEIEGLRFELEQARTQLRITKEERAKDSETLELYQERVRELELTTTNRPQPAPKPKVERTATEDSQEAETPIDESPLSPGAGDISQALDEELDDAIQGTTMTDLKLQVRRLQRELESVRKQEADSSRLLVLENLLEDANRMKTRYEQDYLTSHREKLVLQRDLEEIRSGKSMGDGAEAAIALRQRLNEAIEELETLRKTYAELDVNFESQGRELTITKSNLTLVNKDQLDILASLRESVNEDKADLEAEVTKLQKQSKEISEKNRMQLEQINALLLEKVNLQSEGINQREKALMRERDFGSLRASLAGIDVPEHIKAQMFGMQEEIVALKDALKSSQDRLQKAKQFIKDQDKLFKGQRATQLTLIPAGSFDEAKDQLKIKDDELERQKSLYQALQRSYQKEAELMSSAIHALGMRTVRNQLGASRPQNRPEDSSWLRAQRSSKSPVLAR